MKKLLIGSFFLIFLLVLYFIIYHYPNNQEQVLSPEDQEKLKENLANFYKNNAGYMFLTEKIICKGDIIIDGSQVTEKFSCVSYPPYSFIGEAWYIVSRGNYSWENGWVNTIVGKGTSEIDRIRKIYSNSITEGNIACDIPCYDSLPPRTYDIDVLYSPKEQELKKMFIEMDDNKINNLILNSDYNIKLYYDFQEKLEHSFLFGFRMGWIIPGNFSLNVKIMNGEILDYSIKCGSYENRNTSCDTSKIDKINIDQIHVEGIRSREEYPLLKIKWRAI
jgi:hypothetical protein